MATPTSPHETHLAASCSICLAQLRCSSLHSSQVFNLSFPSKPNIMFVNHRMWISESNNLCLWTCGVCVFTNEWWTDAGEWWLWIESVPVVFFFFFGGFLALWLSVTLCLWLSLLYYIDKRDTERVEFVEIIEYISVVFDCLLVDDCILIY